MLPDIERRKEQNREAPTCIAFMSVPSCSLNLVPTVVAYSDPRPPPARRVPAPAPATAAPVEGGSVVAVRAPAGEGAASSLKRAARGGQEDRIMSSLSSGWRGSEFFTMNRAVS
jgi:hypothetical protein